MEGTIGTHRWSQPRGAWAFAESGSRTGRMRATIAFAQEIPAAMYQRVDGPLCVDTAAALGGPAAATKRRPPTTMSAATTTPVLHLCPTSRSNLAILGTPLHAGLHAVDELPRELASAALKDAAALGYERLVIGGGEPLLYAALPGLLARARRLDFTTTVVTNGTLLGQARRFRPIATLIDTLVLDLHGLEQTHDARCHREGAFAQAIRNLDVVRQSRVRLAFRLTLTKVNAEELAGVVRLAAEHGAAHLEVVRPCGLTRADAELTEYLVDAQALGDELGIEVIGDVAQPEELMLYRGRFVPPFPTREVTELAPSLHIDADGRVAPHSTDVPGRLALGSLHRHRLAALAPAWARSARAAELASACDATWWAFAGTAGTGIRWTEEVVDRLHAVEAPVLVAA